jgi:hypothetical protein
MIDAQSRFENVLDLGLLSIALDFRAIKRKLISERRLGESAQK